MCILCRGVKTIGLKRLNCSYCSFITTIPCIEGLLDLYCFNCLAITSIPPIERLRVLYCYDCPRITSIPIPYTKALECTGCKWLNVNNPEFDHNIKKLKRLQVWFRSILLGT